MTDQVINRRAARRNMSAPAYRMPEADLPDPPSAAQPAAEPEQPADAVLPLPVVTLSTRIAHRGRVITVTATGMTIERFCDLLDSREFNPPT